MVDEEPDDPSLQREPVHAGLEGIKIELEDVGLVGANPNNKSSRMETLETDQCSPRLLSWIELLSQPVANKVECEDCQRDHNSREYEQMRRGEPKLA